jgi:hypothetical protein
MVTVGSNGLRPCSTARTIPAELAISTAAIKHNATVGSSETGLPNFNPDLPIPSLWAVRTMRLL